MTTLNLVKTSKPECIWNSKSYLGEGVLWLSKSKKIYSVDIKKKKILIFEILKNKKKILKVNKEIGFISHFKKDFFILGLKSEIRIVNLKKNKKVLSINVEQDKPYNRINDGVIDPMGRLWFGTMDNLENKKSGSLYCLDNYLKLHLVDKGYFITNGPSFLNKNSFYHTDTKKKIIYKIIIDNNLKIIKKKKFIKFSNLEGSPDGMTTDSKNNLWVCHYHGAQISVYNSKGKKIHKVKFPVKNITNCTFGGNNNKKIFVSTARKGLNKKEIKKNPLSGGLFMFRTNIKGKKIVSFKSKQTFI